MSPITFRRPGPTPPSLLYDELQAAAIHEAAMGSWRGIVYARAVTFLSTASSAQDRCADKQTVTAGPQKNIMLGVSSPNDLIAGQNYAPPHRAQRSSRYRATSGAAGAMRDRSLQGSSV
jgi:hypothetical protein